MRSVKFPISFPVAVLFAAVSFLIGCTNVVYIVVCFKALRRKFFNLMILALCNSDGILGFGCTLFALAPKVDVIRTNVLSCKFQVFALSSSILSSYTLICVLCIQRYVTLRSINVGKDSTRIFERFKYAIVLTTIFITFGYTFGVIFVLPREYEGSNVLSCNPEDLFGFNNFRIFYTAEFLPISMLIILIIIFSAFTCMELFKISTKQKSCPATTSQIHELKQKKESIKDCEDRQIEDIMNGCKNHFVEDVHANKRGKLINCGDENNKNSQEKKKISDSCSISCGQQENGSNNTGNECLQEASNGVSEDNNCNSGTKYESQYSCDQNCQDKVSGNMEELRGATTARKKLKRQEWEVRAFVTSIVIALTAIILTGPFVASIWVDVITGVPFSMEMKMLLFLPISLNIISNPFIYTLRVPEIRREFGKIFICKIQAKTEQSDAGYDNSITMLD